MILKKILEDPYFSETYRKYKSIDAVREAGFFDDGIKDSGYYKESENLSFLTTPVFKIRNNIKKIKGGKKSVLLTTGGFSPIHQGHLQMMEEAKQTAEQRGFKIVGGYISPSHDGYVPKEYTGNRYLKTPHRLALCQEAVYKSNWLMVDPWESRYNKYPLTFSRVIERLRKYLGFHLKDINQPEIIYVFGSDNAAFARAFIGKGKCLCVKRGGYENKIDSIKKESPILSNDRIIISEEKTEKISSSEVRTSVRKNWINGNNNVNKNKDLYVFRDDLEWATKIWEKDRDKNEMDIATKVFKERIKNIFEFAFKSCEFPDRIEKCNFVFIDIKKQTDFVKKTENSGRKLLNLDLITESRNKINLSRLYGISDGQNHASIITERPGFPLFAQQKASVKQGNYIFVDDDIASGETRQLIKNLLSPNYKINRSMSLLDYFLKTHGFKRDKFLDIVDLRDFLVGSSHGGLVVSLPNGVKCRAPYILPYVSLATRAKIPPSMEEFVSYNLWRINYEFFKSIKPALRLADTDPFFRILMKYSGFSDSAEMAEICRWHYQKFADFCNYSGY